MSKAKGQLKKRSNLMRFQAISWHFMDFSRYFSKTINSPYKPTRLATEPQAVVLIVWNRSESHFGRFCVQVQIGKSENRRKLAHFRAKSTDFDKIRRKSKKFDENHIIRENSSKIDKIRRKSTNFAKTDKIRPKSKKFAKSP